MPRATRTGRLLVGAAIGAKGDYLERAAELIRAGVDVIVIDIAHGHSVVMAKAIEAFRARFGDFELVGGNVATAEGVRFLIERGVNARQGRHRPRRRMHDAHHHELRRAADRGAGRVPASRSDAATIPLIADGGVRRHGAIFEALIFGGDTVMLGSMFAGTEETPGEVVQKSVVLPDAQRTVKVPFKVLRGMASIQAIRDRLDVEDADTRRHRSAGRGRHGGQRARRADRCGRSSRTSCATSARRSATAAPSSLAELKEMFWKDPFRYLIKLSASGKRESYER